MMSFRGGRLLELALPTVTVWLLSDIAEAKGRQDLFVRQSPQRLKALQEMALVQSVESSNRIEGVTVPQERLRPLVIGHARPQNRPEQEIQGYRRALQMIHTSAAKMLVTPELLRRLHATCQPGSDAGEWKRTENEIIEFRPNAPPRVRFHPVLPRETPAAVEELCLAFRATTQQRQVHPLVAAGAFVFDFLCIYPFRDGNGRVSRLLTLLTLYHHGYEAGRFISLERLVEDSREDYYEALFRSSQGWHDGAHDLLPWLNFFLGVLRRAYRELEERAGQLKSPRGAKTALVTAAVEAFPGNFTLADVERTCPGVSRDMVRLILRSLRRRGRIVCLGRGPGAAWRKKGNTS
jgi:Fic family protein